MIILVEVSAFNLFVSTLSTVDVRLQINLYAQMSAYTINVRQMISNGPMGPSYVVLIWCVLD